MKTLMELMLTADKAPWEERVPNANTVIDSGSPVIASEKAGDETDATVFQNGYVIYRKGKHTTVFPLHTCREYRNVDATGNEHILPFEVFADQPWLTRVFMEGEDRIIHSKNAIRRHAGELSHDTKKEGWGFLMDKGANDPLNLMIEAETWREEHEKLQSLLETLTERQHFILMECVVNGRMQEDVAKEIGTTRMNVSIQLQRVLKKMRDAFGISWKSFYRNHFYREEAGLQQG